MSLPQKTDRVGDPTTDPRVEKIELIYKRFLETLEGLSKEQRQVIQEALAELNHRQITEVRAQLNHHSSV